MVARDFSVRMVEQGIPFFRFNPQLDEDVPSGETDLTKLQNMLFKVSLILSYLVCFILYCWQTKRYVMNDGEKGASMMDELAKLFLLVPENRRKCAKLDRATSL